MRGTEISYFPQYSTKENRTTNYFLLILKCVYEETPELFDELITSFIDDGLKSKVGISFKQQVVKKYNSDKDKTIPEGVIKQEPFTIFVETKNSDWFTKDQLKNHINALREEIGIKVLLALANFEHKDNEKFQEIEKYVEEINNDDNNQIIFKALSFEDVVSILDTLPIKSARLISIIDDFKVYLDEENYLPNWKYRLDVVNCARSMDSVINNNVYVCPEAIGAYKHNKCKYFGIYKDKAVKNIAEIVAIVDVYINDEMRVKWILNSDKSEKEIIDIAKEKLCIINEKYRPIQLFILKNFINTNFEKTSSGGMFGSKQYFEFHGVQNINDLAQKLQLEKW